MDFPNDIATNVYKIDDVTVVYWAVYTGRCKEEQGVDENSVKVRKEQLKSTIQALGWSLRGTGKHVFVDEDKLDVWIFCFSEAERKEALETLESDLLECSGSGCARSTDLGLSQGHGGIIPKSVIATSQLQRSAGAVNDLNKHPFNAHPTSAAQPLESGSECLRKHSFLLSDLYPKLLLAVSQSVTYSLSKTERFTQIGYSTCLDVRSLGENVFDHLDVGISTKDTIAVTCSVRWLSAGPMLFEFRPEPIARLCTLSYTLSGNESSAVINPGDPLLLSPSGFVGQYYGVDKMSATHPSYKIRAETKAIITAGLSRSGISLPQRSQWICVLVREEEGQADNAVERTSDIQGTRLTMWPAHLCFCEAVDIPAESSFDYTLAGSPTLATDPLKKAQAWFLGRHERVDKLKAMQHEAAVETEEAERLKAVEITKDEDASSDFQIHANQAVTPRDFSGIYPTPPDGLPSVILNPSIENDLHSRSNDNEKDEGTANDRLHKQPEAKRHDDLFGEMDIDVFATNGLTEDDFSFFDEPDGKLGVSRGELDAMYGHDDFVVQEPLRAPTTLAPLDDQNRPKIQDGRDTVASPDQGPYQDSQYHGHGEGKIDDLNQNGRAMEEKDSPSCHSHKKVMANVKDKELPGPRRCDLEFGSNLPKCDPTQKASFNFVDFPNSPFSFDDKYALQGRYGYDLHHLSRKAELGNLSPSLNRTLPHVGRPQPTSFENSMETDITDDELSTKSSDISQYYDDDDDDNDGDDNGEEEEEGEEEADDRIPQHSHRKRKWSPSETGYDPATPLSSASANEIPEKQETMIEITPESSLFTLKASRDVFNLDKVGSRLRTSDTAVAMGYDRNFIQIAQMVADQVVSAFDRFRTRNSPDHVDIKTTELQHQLEGIFTKWSSKGGKAIKRCTLKDFLEVDDRGLRDQVPQSQRMQKTANPVRAVSMAGQSLNKLCAPYASVQRTGATIDIATSALSFWEELSLGPSNGNKNVTAYCIYPGQLNVQDQVKTFLSMIKSAYQSCNLGLHNTGPDLAHIVNGLVPVPMGIGRMQDQQSQTDRAFETFGKGLGKLKLQSGNTVVYVIEPPDHEGSLPRLCAAFLRLCGTYSAAVREGNVEKPNDLVLQVIPSTLVYSRTFLSMPSPSDYRKLAFEVYDRCAPERSGTNMKRSPYVCAPSIRLAQAVPKVIEFRLTPENSALSLQSDNHLHVGYAWTLGEDWLTAAWTDNLGNVSWNACYYLGEGLDTPWHSLLEIATEIWETTLQMLEPRNGPWRIFLCKNGTVCKEEMDAWQSIFSTNSQTFMKSPVLFTFLTIDSEPLPGFPVQDGVARGMELTASFHEAPDDTLQVHTISPDAAGLTSTPGGQVQASTPPPGTAFGDHDMEARLIDITDETWAVVLNRSVDLMSITTNTCPALASGLLLKRAGPRDVDGLVRIGVNIICGPKPYKPLLKAVLNMYRNLGLLARIRGIVDPLKSVMPYHMAAAAKAHAAVSSTMRYGEK